MNNTARFAGGSTLKSRYSDIVYNAEKPTADDVPAVDIIQGIINRAGLGVKLTE